MVTTTDQGLSYIQYEADGVAVNFVLTFPYLNQTHVHVYLDGVETTAFTWLNASEITMNTAPINLALLTVKRLTQQDERIVDFQDGGVIREATLDLDSNQMFYLVQEAIDTTAFNLAIDSTTSLIDAQNNKIINVANGVSPQDAVTKSQLDVVGAAAAAAVITADAAEVTANAIAATAAAALATANAAAVDAAAAVITANDAEATALAINAVAVAAAADAAAAIVTANDAAADAAAAIVTANGAAADVLLRELLTNKATDFSTVNDTLYPTVKAVNDKIASGLSGLSAFMFSSIDSDIATYESIPILANFVAGALATVSGSVSTTPTILLTLATPSGYPNITSIPVGVLTGHYETIKSSGGGVYYTYFTISKRNLAGTETLLITSDNSSQYSINTVISHDMGAFNSSTITLLNTDRLVIKIYAVMVSGTATITVRYDDNTASRLELPVITLGYIPENQANKDIDATMAANSDVKYPSQKAVKSAIAVQTGSEVTGGSIKNPAVLESKRDTKGNLDIYAALGTSVNGQFVFATDLKKMYQIIDNILAPIGGASGGLTTMFQLIAEENITDWTTGDNATFLGAGAISGTFAKETSTPIQGLASYKYTQAAGSLDDYMASAAQALDLRFRGRECTFSMSNKYDGATGDIEVIFYDVTNATVLPSSVFIQGNTSLNRFATNIFVPATCTSIRVGFQTRVLNSGKIFEFDSIEFGLDSTVFANVANIQSSLYLTGSTISGGGYLRTATVVSPPTKPDYLSYFDVIDHATNGTRVYAKVAGLYHATAQNVCSASTQLDLNLYLGRSGTEYSIGRVRENAGSATLIALVSGSTWMEVGDYLSCSNAGSNGSQSTTTFTVAVEARTSNILITPDTFSTDTSPLVYASSAAYTLATLNNAPVGTFITYTYTASSNTRVQTVAAPTQTTSSMNTNGILLTPRAYNATGAATTPSTFLVQIGKGLLGFTPTAFISLGKVTPFETRLYGAVAGVAEYGVITNYDPITGILTLDSGANFSASTTVRYCGLTLITNASNATGYMTVTASKNPALTGLNINAVAARGVNTAGTSVGSGTEPVMVYDTTKTYDTHNALVTSTGIFTAPESGYYIASWGCLLTSGGGWGGVEAIYSTLNKNGTAYAIGLYQGTEASNTVQHGTVGSSGVYLAKMDTLSVTLYQSSGGSLALNTSVGANYFSIHKTNVG
jgi:hypothetical protein